jgi:hypothetical protein
MSVIDGSPCDAVSVGAESQLYEFTAWGASVKVGTSVTEFEELALLNNTFRERRPVISCRPPSLTKQSN